MKTPIPYDQDDSAYLTSMALYLVGLAAIIAFVAFGPGCRMPTAEEAATMKELLPELCVEKEGWRMCLSRTDGFPPNGVGGGFAVAGPDRCLNDGGGGGR